MWLEGIPQPHLIDSGRERLMWNYLTAKKLFCLRKDKVPNGLRHVANLPRQQVGFVDLAKRSTRKKTRFAAGIRIADVLRLKSTPD